MNTSRLRSVSLAVVGLISVGAMSGCSDTSETSATPSLLAFDASTPGYGDDINLDVLWDACADGEMGACDDLWAASPVGSDYERFGAACGLHRLDVTVCVAE